MKTLINLFLISFTLIIFANRSFTQGTWVIDNAHTNVKFTVTHLVISEVEGNFKTFTGTMLSSKPDFTDAKIDFSVDVASINTDNEMRDNHLKSDDFFNAEKYPKMSFKSILSRRLATRYMN